jgi:myo-inositol catabolism protein IolC
MARSFAVRKEKKTFSLSREAVSYVEGLRKQARKSSSEVLEELILSRKLASEHERVSEAIRRYYDSLDVEEQAENRIWGQLAESQFSSE